MIQKTENRVKISIIVPVYNVEMYIEQLVTNIQLQKYSNFEVIFVDDGSTDKSLSLLKEASQLDARFKVYHKENTGTGASRNFGTKLATGKYLYYMDPDDIMDADLLYENVQIAEKNKSDVVVFGFDTVNSDGLVLESKKYDSLTQCLQGHSVSSHFEELYQEFFFHALWHKLFRRDFIINNEIISPTWSNSQDRGFMVKVGSFNPNITFNQTNKTYYKYVQMRKNSSTDKYKKNLMEISIQLVKLIEKLVTDNHIELNERLFYDIYVHDVYFYAGIINFSRKGAPKGSTILRSYLIPFYQNNVVNRFLNKKIIYNKNWTIKENFIFFIAKYKLSSILLRLVRIKKRV